MRRFAWLMVAVAAGSACGESRQLEAAPDVVRATFNPQDSVVPTPTNLVRDDVTETLDLPTDGDLTPAEIEFRGYLNLLDGYPLQSTLRIPTDAPVDEAGLSASFFLTDMAEGAPLRVRAEFEDDAIVAHPLEAFQPGRTYAFALAGYEQGPRGLNGAPLIADAPFYLVRSESPLTEHVEAMPGSSHHERVEIAERLAEVQERYRPLFDVFARFGVTKSEIAAMSRFTTTNRPAVWFDGDAGRVPIPNSILIDPATGLVEVPEDEEDDQEARDLKEILNTYDGFSTSAPLRFEATRRVDQATVNLENVRLYALRDGEFVREREVSIGVLDDGVTIWVRPDLALEDASDYALIVTRGVTASGTGLEAQPVAAMLRSRAPLIVDGVPQLDLLDVESAERLEPLRQKMQPLLDALETEGILRSDIAAAIPVRTLSALDSLSELRASLYERDVPVGLRNVLIRTPVERGLPVIMRDVETIVSGEVTTLDYIDPATRRFRPSGVPEERTISFVATIPEGVAPGQKIPTVLFGHGLLTSRELVYMIANKLAENGWASFAIDLPYHGRRSVCLGPADCVDSMCNELGQCVRPDGSRGDLATIASPWPDGPEFPATTGSAFVEVDNIAGSRDHFAQAVIDLAQGLRIVRGADWAGDTGYALDGDDVVYLGMSLGGILGAMLSGIEPTLTDFVLNVPGANLFQLLTVSDVFEGIFDDVLEHRDIERGSDAFFEFESGLRWLLDDVDPLNLAHYATVKSFEYVDSDGQTRQSPTKRVMIQMAEGDIVVPNAATRSLSERMEVPIRTYTPSISNHAFLFDPVSFEGARARQDLVEFFDAR